MFSPGIVSQPNNVIASVYYLLLISGSVQLLRSNLVTLCLLSTRINQSRVNGFSGWFLRHVMIGQDSIYVQESI